MRLSTKLWVLLIKLRTPLPHHSKIDKDILPDQNIKTVQPRLLAWCEDWSYT